MSVNLNLFTNETADHGICCDAKLAQGKDELGLKSILYCVTHLMSTFGGFCGNTTLGEAFVKKTFGLSAPAVVRKWKAWVTVNKGMFLSGTMFLPQFYYFP